MLHPRRTITMIFAFLTGVASCDPPPNTMENPPRDLVAAGRTRPLLTRDLAAKGLDFGAPVFIRAFKESLELELFVMNRKCEKFELFRTYGIAKSSGELGPKWAEGDGQVPEGFYAVPPSAMNPKSQFQNS